MQKWYQLYLGSWQNPTLSQGMWCPHACAEVLHAGCRRPGYRSTAEHILTLCKDKEYAVPFLAGQYQKSLIDHALHRLDSQISMVSRTLAGTLLLLMSRRQVLSQKLPGEGTEDTQIPPTAAACS